MLNQSERDAKLATHIEELERQLGFIHARLELARLLNEAPDFNATVTMMERELSIYRTWMEPLPSPDEAKTRQEWLKDSQKGAWLVYCYPGLHELRPATREEEYHAKEGRNAAGFSWCPMCKAKSNASIVFKSDRVQDGATARRCHNCTQDTVQVGEDQDICSKCGAYCGTAGRSPV